MIVPMAFTAVAFAGEQSEWADGFVSPPRDDAPTDGILVFAANIFPVATVVSGPGAPFALEVEGIARGRVGLLPPVGGWMPGATYAVSALGPDGLEAGTLDFTAGDRAAPEAGALPLVTLAEQSAWTHPTYYQDGCCFPVRELQLDIAPSSTDPWAWAVVEGEPNFGRPETFAAVLGPTPQTVRVLQYADEGGVHPPCFDVTEVSAAGVASASTVTLCADDPPPPPPAEAPTEMTTQPARGCTSAGGPVAPWLAAVAALGLRRARAQARRTG